MARTRSYRSPYFPLIHQEKETAVCLVCIDYSFLVITERHMVSLRGLCGERETVDTLAWKES